MPTTTTTNTTRVDFQNWDENDVAKYLKKEGLGDYTEPLINHKISGNIIPFVKDTDLKEMGFVVVGDRIRMQNKIVELQRNHRKEARTEVLWTGKEELYFGGERIFVTCCFLFPDDGSKYTLFTTALKIKVVEPPRCFCLKFRCCNEYSVDNVELSQVVDVDVVGETPFFPFCCLRGKDKIIVKTVDRENILFLKKGKGEALADMIKNQVEETHMMRNINVQRMNRN